MTEQNTSIEVEGISKKFTTKYATFYGGVKKSGTKQVLNNISFELKKGQVLGIIGKNGSGKSTLLKILSDIMKPDTGVIKVFGKVASILELGMGFDSESSGRNNIRIKCSMYGLSNDEITAEMENIIKFSELGDQIDFPLRTYSSGMIAKLAFSIAAHVKCDILILDEVLSVGDASFNYKCKAAFKQMREKGRSIIIASHNISTIEEMCDSVIWIADGSIKEWGDPSTVCYHYQTDMLYSLDTVLKMGEQGDVFSINRAGEIYRDGIGVEKNLEKAEEYFLQAADQGYILAFVNLGNIKLIKGDFEEAEKYFTIATKMGDHSATSSIIMLKDNKEICTNLKKELEKLSEEGNIRAMKLLADMLFNGGVFPKNIEESLKWYNKCAELYDGHSQYILGICYRDGLGVEKDIPKSINYLKNASDSGFSKSRIELAHMYHKGIGVNKDMSEAIKWYTLSAKAGDPTSMIQLGSIFRDGLGVTPNEDYAKYWFKKHSEIELSNCEFYFADIIKQGYSGERQKEALLWYEDSANRGNIRSIGALAALYKEGMITPPNSKKMTECYIKMTEMMNPDGMYELGMSYYKGQGVEQDFEKAYEYIQKSANMGHAPAQYQLAHMYSTGIGTNADPDRAQIISKLLSYKGNLSSRIQTYEFESNKEKNKSMTE